MGRQFRVFVALRKAFNQNIRAIAANVIGAKLRRKIAVGRYHSGWINDGQATDTCRNERARAGCAV